jgi:hypothetical protein
MQFPMSGANDNGSSRTCGLAVYKNNERLVVDRLPYATTLSRGDDVATEIVPPTINGIAMAPDGTIMATNFYGLYQYKTASVTPPPGIFPGERVVQPGILLDGIAGRFDLARGYLLLLSAVLGKHTQGEQKDEIIPVGTSTQFQTLFKSVSDVLNNL